jgi:hypothetical protein
MAKRKRSAFSCKSRSQRRPSPRLSASLGPPFTALSRQGGYAHILKGYFYTNLVGTLLREDVHRARSQRDRFSGAGPGCVVSKLSGASEGSLSDSLSTSAISASVLLTLTSASAALPQQFSQKITAAVIDLDPQATAPKWTDRRHDKHPWVVPTLDIDFTKGYN